MSLFSPSLVKQVRAFSYDHAESSRDLYAKRNQSIHNLADTIFKSKLCEWHVYYILRNSGKKVTQPCMKILDAKDKSYDADILDYEKNIKIHVKSQTLESSLKYGTSFILQRNDPIVTNHWLAFTIYNDIDDIRLLGFLNATHAIYEDTKLKHQSKCAIYLDSVQRYMG